MNPATELSPGAAATIEDVAHPYERIPLILVTGIGRSGTTVLRTALGLHPAIDSTGLENNIIHDLLGVALTNCTIPSRRQTMRVSLDRYESLFRNLILDLLWPEPEVGASPPRSLLAFSALTPERADFFLRLFPSARIIGIVRHGVEVVASRMRYQSFAANPFAEHCERWASFQALAEWGETRSFFKLVRHERLRAEDDALDATFDHLWTFLNLDADPACTESVRSTVHHPTTNGSDPPDHRSALADRQHRWRTWSEEQKEIFLATCADAMAYFGYELPF